ncbi:hypothetical protein J4441_03485 [Candidatus Micrarchaeota archaeon]|nr:hypothetical protein [Candidatus Micrarchaeota archaeon]
MEKKRDWKKYERELGERKQKIVDFILSRPTAEELLKELEKLNRRKKGRKFQLPKSVRLLFHFLKNTFRIDDRMLAKFLSKFMNAILPRQSPFGHSSTTAFPLPNIFKRYRRTPLMNELTFLDLAVLLKIDAESTVEKFGSSINTSFFETANLLGTMKLKGYLDIMSSVGGLSRVVLTDAGASILSVANEKARESLDSLDQSILSTLASGVRELDGISSAINIRQGDLAYHLHKLSVQQYVDYTLRSAKISISLTEKGFNSTGGIRAQSASTASPAGTAATSRPPAASEGTSPAQPAPSQATLFASSQPKPTGSSPPWVDKKLVGVAQAASAASEDVDALIAHPQQQAQEKKHPIEAKHASAQHQRPKDIKTVRLLSKLEHYITAYLPYILLLVVLGTIALVALAAAYMKLS